jgi:para-nitrobenzyl esterase
VLHHHDPKTVGAYHSGDIPYWLGTWDAFNIVRITRNWTEADRALSDLMSTAIVTFATTGSPTHDGEKDWPVYRSGNELIRELDVHSRVVAWPDSGKMDFFVEHHPQDRGPAATEDIRLHRPDRRRPARAK